MCEREKVTLPSKSSVTSTAVRNGNRNVIRRRKPRTEGFRTRSARKRSFEDTGLRVSSNMSPQERSQKKTNNSGHRATGRAWEKPKLRDLNRPVENQRKKTKPLRPKSSLLSLTISPETTSLPSRAPVRRQYGNSLLRKEKKRLTVPPRKATSNTPRRSFRNDDDDEYSPPTAEIQSQDSIVDLLDDTDGDSVLLSPSPMSPIRSKRGSGNKLDAFRVKMSTLKQRNAQLQEVQFDWTRSEMVRLINSDVAAGGRILV